MKAKLPNLIAIFIVFLLLIVISVFVLRNQATEDSSAGTQIEYFVSNGGDDSNPGNIDKPFKTLARAKDEVRKNTEKGLKSNVVVYLKGGIYQFSEPLVFDSKDGGTSKYSVTYRSYQGENVRFSGSVDLPTWQKEKNDIWSTNLSELKIPQNFFRNLYRGNLRLQRARFPNEGQYMRVVSNSGDLKTIKFDTQFPIKLAGTSVEAVIFYHWDIGRGKISAGNGDNLKTQSPMGQTDHEFSRVAAGNSAFLENAYEFIDQPGEWYYDQVKSRLYLKLDSNDNPNEKARLLVPVTRQLINVVGTSNSKVTNLHFYGITFENTDWDYGSVGFSGVQAGHYLLDGTKYSVIPGAVHFENVTNSSFKFNFVNNIGSSGITLGKGVQGFDIENNEFIGIGANCVHVGYNPDRGHLGGDWSQQIINRDGVISNVRIENNKISRCGEIFWGGNGIFVQYTKGSVIKNNDVSEIAYTGIGVTSSWGVGRTSQENAKIINNHVYNVTTRLADGGGIYTTGESPNSEISSNLVHDVRRSMWSQGAPNNGLYFDESSKGYLVENNIVYNVNGEIVRYNRTGPENFTFKTNYLNVSRSASNFPADIASKAGLKNSTCSDYIYTAWSSCEMNTQTRRILLSFPMGCNLDNKTQERSCQ